MSDAERDYVYGRQCNVAGDSPEPYFLAGGANKYDAADIVGEMTCVEGCGGFVTGLPNAPMPGCFAYAECCTSGDTQVTMSDFGAMKPPVAATTAYPPQCATYYEDCNNDVQGYMGEPCMNLYNDCNA